MPFSYSLVTGAGDIPYTDLPDLYANPPVSLEEMFRQLSYGELHDLEMGLDGVGNITPDRRNQVIQMLNEGLRKLHMRFELISTIQDVTVPMSNTVLVVPFNVMATQVVSLLTPSGASISYLTQPVPGEIFAHNRRLSFPPTHCDYKVQITWQRRHPTLRFISVDADLQQPIYLSVEMWAILRAYVAGEIYGNMNTQDAVMSATKYRTRFEALCAEIEATGGTPQGMLDNQAFHRRGFV